MEKAGLVMPCGEGCGSELLGWLHTNQKQPPITIPICFHLQEALAVPSTWNRPSKPHVACRRRWLSSNRTLPTTSIPQSRSFNIVSPPIALLRYAKQTRGSECALHTCRRALTRSGQFAGRKGPLSSSCQLAACDADRTAGGGAELCSRPYRMPFLPECLTRAAGDVSGPL